MLAGSDSQKAHWLPQLAAGSVIGCLAVNESAGEPAPDTLQSSFSDGEVSGSKIPVADGDIAHLAVTLVNTSDGPTAVLIDLNQTGVTRTPVKTIDPSRSHARLDFAKASAEVLGEPGQGWSLLQRVYDRAAVLFAGSRSAGRDIAEHGKGICPWKICVRSLHR